MLLVEESKSVVCGEGGVVVFLDGLYAFARWKLRGEKDLVLRSWHSGSILEGRGSDGGDEVRRVVVSVRLSGKKSSCWNGS